MKLSEYADARLVVTDVAEGEVGEILAQLIAPLASGGFVDDTADVLAALISREEVLSTGIGLGIAVPHAISGSLTDPHLVIGLSEGGVDFKSIDGGPVNVFFVLLSPRESAGHHIRMLARIARLARHPEFVDALRTTKDPELVVAHIDRYEREHV